ncbi:MAG TPA: hypothetical protein VHG33_04905 [Woeseiaceae bacterium]|nr:hypothetical protein [Woeseiaceae bacterium]
MPGSRCTGWRRRTSDRPGALDGPPVTAPLTTAAVLSGGTATAAGIGAIMLAGVSGLAACGPTFQQMAATECAGIATDTAYQDCRQSLARRLADERLGYIVRSQAVR